MGGHPSVGLRSETEIEREREPQFGAGQVGAGIGSKAAPAAPAAVANVQNGNPHEIDSADRNHSSNGARAGGESNVDTRISVEQLQLEAPPKTTSSSSFSSSSSSSSPPPQQQRANGAGPSTRKKTATASAAGGAGGGEGRTVAAKEDLEGMVGVTIEDAEAEAEADSVKNDHRMTEDSGADGTTTSTVPMRGVEQDSSSSAVEEEEDSRFYQRGNDPSIQGAAAAGTAAAVAEAEGVEMTGAVATQDQHQAPPSPTSAGAMSPALNSSSNKSADSHLIDIPPKEQQRSKAGEELDRYKVFSVARTTSNFSVESATGDQCRICQQHAEEPLMDLGCHCRGELAKAHRSCVDHWFGNKGTNKCEVCQHVATNVPAPASQPTPHFWVWRVGGPYNGASLRRVGGGARFHPLWAALLILVAGLLFDILISIFLGASALPVNIIIGVLVVLGLGTAARLVLECWHERVIRRNIQRMEEDNTYEEFHPEQQPQPQLQPTAPTTTNSNSDSNAASNNSDHAVVELTAEGQPSSNAPPSPTPPAPAPPHPPPDIPPPSVPPTTPATSTPAPPSQSVAAAAGHAEEGVSTAASVPNGTGS